MVLLGSSGSQKAQDALAFLRGRITSGQWPINTAIPKEPELMELMGVGKSTVREAVRSLASVGMLETVRGVGTFVRAQTPVVAFLATYLDDYEATDIIAYRRALEIEACQLAATRRSEEQLAGLRASLAHDLDADPDMPPTVERGETPGPFHHLIFAAADNPLLSGLYTGVMASLRKERSLGRVARGSDHQARQADHGLILQAIEEQDVAKAAHAMALHVDRDLVVPGASPAPDVAARLHALIGQG